MPSIHGSPQQLSSARVRCNPLGKQGAPLFELHLRLRLLCGGGGGGRWNSDRLLHEREGRLYA
jgi:hypothetical protein